LNERRRPIGTRSAHGSPEIWSRARAKIGHKSLFSARILLSPRRTIGQAGN